MSRTIVSNLEFTPTRSIEVTSKPALLLPAYQPRSRPGSPYLEMRTPNAVLFAVRWLLIGLVALVCHVVLVRDGGVACFVLLMGALLVLHQVNPLAGFIIYIQVLMYQNVVISLFTETMTSSQYTLCAGTSFIAGLVLVIGPTYRLLESGSPFQARHRGMLRTTRYVAIAIVVALLYLALGAATAGPTPAVVSFRNATAMLFAVIIGLDIGDRWGYRTIATCFVASASLGVFLACIEIADPAWYLATVHAASFANLKNYQSVKAYLFSAENVIDTMLSLPFNTDAFSAIMPGLAYRFGGPNMHSISYGYVLSVTALVALSLRRYLAVIPLVVLLVLIGVKGSLILLVATLALYGVWRATASVRLLLVCGSFGAAAYVGYGIWRGLQDGDFHVLGFLGGVNGFVANPLGHGLGHGGNLSVGTLGQGKWETFQHDGAADVGMESAVGVLLYQMGVGCAAIVAAIVVLLRSGPFGVAWRKPNPTDLLFIGLCVGLVNGVFQEEAYSPYAVGLLAMFGGVLVANGQRPARWLGAERA